MELIRELMREWYFLLSQASVALGGPVKHLADWVQLPLLTVLLAGLVGSLSPCQLTTNLSAMAYLSRKVGERGALREALAYTLGKVLVYTLAGGAVIFLGFQLDRVAIPLVVATRKSIGPLMIIIGLGLMGLVRLRGSLGSRLASWLHPRLPHGEATGAFSLGVAFSFSFCPTLFWLFFGLMIPLALISTGGWTFPALFAVGTALPLLLFASLLASGSKVSHTLMERLKQSRPMISRLAGAIFITAGLNDTLTYWII
ncbi:MAG: sulfite exporter TauE/SafE family protein [Deltaproteobacteria bacterium]|nr:sulfite exporter TauE/SafE family protein [Deltaproteobacteria bacterium]